MKKIFCFILSAISFSSYSQQIINLWSEANPAPHRSVITVPESAPDDGGRISGTSIPTIQVFLPKNAANAKAIVICPGGGYYLTTTYNEGTYYAEYLADNGIAGVVLKYRMPQGVHQIPLEDVKRAMDIVRSNAAVWGIDTAKIGVMGFSAGGHLAACAATMLQDKPAFSVLFYPVISLRKGITHEGSRELLIGDAPLRSYYSAELNVTPSTPPSLIIHCTDDKTVSVANSYIYSDALNAAGVKNRLVIYDKGGHGWGFSKDFPYHNQVKTEMVEWIKAH